MYVLLWCNDVYCVVVVLYDGSIDCWLMAIGYWLLIIGYWIQCNVMFRLQCFTVCSMLSLKNNEVFLNN